MYTLAVVTVHTTSPRWAAMMVSNAPKMSLILPRRPFSAIAPSYGEEQKECTPQIKVRTSVVANIENDEDEKAALTHIVENLCCAKVRYMYNLSKKINVCTFKD